jgi:hypothetical protein
VIDRGSDRVVSSSRSRGRARPALSGWRRCSGGPRGPHRRACSPPRCVHVRRRRPHALRVGRARGCLWGAYACAAGAGSVGPPCLWREARPLRFRPRDLSDDQSGAMDRSRGEWLRVPAADEKHVLWLGGRDDRRVDDASRLASGEYGVSRVWRGSPCLSVVTGISRGRRRVAAYVREQQRGAPSSTRQSLSLSTRMSSRPDRHLSHRRMPRCICTSWAQAGGRTLSVLVQVGGGPPLLGYGGRGCELAPRSARVAFRSPSGRAARRVRARINAGNRPLRVIEIRASGRRRLLGSRRRAKARARVRVRAGLRGGPGGRTADDAAKPRRWRGGERGAARRAGPAVYPPGVRRASRIWRSG